MHPKEAVSFISLCLQYFHCLPLEILSAEVHFSVFSASNFLSDQGELAVAFYETGTGRRRITLFLQVFRYYERSLQGE